MEPTTLVQERLLSSPVGVKTLRSVLKGDIEAAGTEDWTGEQTGPENGSAEKGE
jgi:hypothetical protein